MSLNSEATMLRVVVVETIDVAVEYPDLTNLAADDAKTMADLEYMAIIKGLDKKRKTLSDSLHEAMK